MARIWRARGASNGSWVRVLGLASLVAAGLVAGGTAQAETRSAPGLVFAAGSNYSGQLGQEVTSQPQGVVRVPGLSGVIAVSAGAYHNLALKSDGTVWAWGRNAEGELAQGMMGPAQPLPIQVPGLTGIVAIAAGASHNLALRSDGTLWAWGWNLWGQVGDGSFVDRSTPVQVVGLSGVVAASAGEAHSLAVTSDGSVWGWGNNWMCALGYGQCSDEIAVPVQAMGIASVMAIVAGGDSFTEHSHAIKADGTLWSWGSNYYGQLGIGYGHPQTPTQVPGLADIVAVAAGMGHTLVIRADGTVWACGDNDSGQLGDGSEVSQHTLVSVLGLTGITAVAADRWDADGGFSLALRSDGTVWGWGSNGIGSWGLVQGYYKKHPIPIQVPGLAGVSAISAGATHSLFLRVWPGDLNGDGDIDSDDVTAFKTCLTGPGVTTPLSAACQPADLDRDLDVDMSDFGILQRCFSGPDVLADPDCSH